MTYTLDNSTNQKWIDGNELIVMLCLVSLPQQYIYISYINASTNLYNSEQKYTLL